MTTKHRFFDLTYDTPHDCHTHEVAHISLSGAVVITQHYSAEDAERERAFLAQRGRDAVVTPVKAEGIA
jgi:hypothetical protein